MAKAKTKGQEKFDKTMQEWGQGKLKSSSGKKVTSQSQALAIAFSEKEVAIKNRKNKGGK